MTRDVFISYAKEDRQVAEAVAACLEREGIRCWYAPRDIQPGDEWGEAIYQAIVSCQLFLLIFSKNSNQSRRVLDELNLAIKENKFVLPFRIDNIESSGAMRLHLTTRQWLDAFEPSWQDHLNELIKLIASRFPDNKPTPVKITEPKSSSLPKETTESGRSKPQPHPVGSVTIKRPDDERFQSPHLNDGKNVEGSSARKPRFLFALGLFAILALAVFLMQVLRPFSAAPQTQSTHSGDTPEAELTLDASEVLNNPKISPKDKMQMVFVPAGEFTMGDDTLTKNTKPAHTVYLDAFWMDQTEVTNAQYLKCMDDGACSVPAASYASPAIINYESSAYANHPIVNVDWQQASDYCRWAGRRLPTEAEWEKAARGDDQRLYPWGNQAPGQNILNYDRQVGKTRSVGNYPGGASPYGAMDMAGNVWEWTADWYDASYYSHSQFSNPQGPPDGEAKVMRGGSWMDDAKAVNAVVRVMGLMGSRYNTIGFRCAESS